MTAIGQESLSLMGVALPESTSVQEEELANPRTPSVSNSRISTGRVPGSMSEVLVAISALTYRNTELNPVSVFFLFLSEAVNSAGFHDHVLSPLGESRRGKRKKKGVGTVEGTESLLQKLLA